MRGSQPPVPLPRYSQSLPGRGLPGGHVQGSVTIDVPRGFQSVVAGPAGPEPDAREQCAAARPGIHPQLAGSRGPGQHVVVPVAVEVGCGPGERRSRHGQRRERVRVAREVIVADVVVPLREVDASAGKARLPAAVERLGRVVQAPCGGPDRDARQPPGAGDGLPAGGEGVQAVGEAGVPQAPHEALDDVPVLPLLHGGGGRPGLGRPRLHIDPDDRGPEPGALQARDGVPGLGVTDIRKLPGPGRRGPGSLRAVRRQLGRGGEGGHGVGVGPFVVAADPAHLAGQAGILGEGKPPGQPDHDELRRRRGQREPQPADRRRTLGPGNIVAVEGGRLGRRSGRGQHPGQERQDGRDRPQHC